MLNYLKMLWKSEPVRVAVYSVVVVLAALLVTKGVADGSTVDFVLAAVAAALGVPAAEVTRSKVTPVA